MTITTPISSEEGWSFQWKQLYEEVITSGLCTGCAGCVIVCPHDVIGYKHEPGAYVPFHLEDELGITDCSHGFGNAKGKGCTECTKACPRFARGKPKPMSTFTVGLAKTTRCPASTPTSCWFGRAKSSSMTLDKTADSSQRC